MTCFTPENIRGYPVGNLEKRLRQAVSPERETNQRQIVTTGQCLRIDRKHRQDEEKTQHAQGKYGSQGNAGAAFIGAHAVGGGRHGQLFLLQRSEASILAGLYGRPALTPSTSSTRRPRSQLLK